MPRVHRVWLTCAIAVLAAPWSLGTAAPRKGATSRAAREEAVRAVPFDKLQQDARAKVSGVLEAAMIFRRLPSVVIECDPTLYLFLLDHPDVVVNIWQVLGISRSALLRTGDQTFRADDGAGTLGSIEYLYRSHDTHVVYAEGTYEGALFSKRLGGRCVLVLKTGYVHETNGRYYITCRLDAFVELDSNGVELVARTLQPLMGAAADHNFRETAAFVAGLSRAAEANQAGLERLAKKLTNVESADRERFIALTERLAIKAALAKTAKAKPAATARRPTRRPAKR